MRAPLLLLALTACIGSPEDAGDGDGGKADALTSKIPTKRRMMDYVRCPANHAKAKVAFFDADSTLRVSKVPGAVTATERDDVFVLPYAASEIARLSKEGYVIAIVSNQGGVSTGKETLATAEAALAYTVKQLARLGGRVNYFDLAEAYDNFRKPNVGMSTLLDQKLKTKCGAGIDLAASFMVGDSGYKKDVDGPHPDGRPADDFSNSDRLFAENLKVPFHEPTDFFHWKDHGVFNIASREELVALLDKLETRADELREAGGDEAEIEALEAESRNNRAVNGL